MIFEIQRKDPTLNTKASEKSLNQKLEQEEHKIILRGPAIHTGNTLCQIMKSVLM